MLYPESWCFSCTEMIVVCDWKVLPHVSLCFCSTGYGQGHVRALGVSFQAEAGPHRLHLMLVTLMSLEQPGQAVDTRRTQSVFPPLPTCLHRLLLLQLPLCP